MKRVLMLMSSGVDSTVAAFLLKNQGYEVIGLTMQMSEQSDCLSDSGSTKSCCGVMDSIICRRVCRKLEIPHYVLNMKEKFKEKVIDPFISDYLTGQTPTPCVNCNTFIKFDEAFKFADEHGCDYIATGHYARIENGQLYRSMNPQKDQTYFLANVPKKRLSQMLFPLNSFETKEEVRGIARKNGLENAEKRESQEICFVPNDDYRQFLKDNSDELPESGNFIDESGNILGEHSGIHNYTIGQRKNTVNKKFVIRISHSNNEIVLSDKSLNSRTIIVRNFNWLVNDNTLYNAKVLTTKIRSGKLETHCRIKTNCGDILVLEAEEGYFVNPTKGQNVVLYDNELVIGGGTLYEAI